MRGEGSAGKRLTRDVRTRVSPDQRERIFAAALKANQTPADFIRDAALRRAEEVLGQEATAFDRFRDFIGLFDVPESFSTQTGKRFAELLGRRRLPRRSDP